MGRKLDKYSQIVTQIFTEYAELLNRRPKADRETELVIDPVRNHYALHTLGWQDEARIWNTPLYVRIRNDKIFVEIDWMEDGIVDRLLDASVSNPRADSRLPFILHETHSETDKQAWLQYAPPLSFTEEQSIELTDIRLSVGDYIAEAEAQFVLGGLDLDADWQTYLDTLESLGLPRMVQIYQESYSAKYGQ